MTILSSLLSKRTIRRNCTLCSLIMLHIAPVRAVVTIVERFTLTNSLVSQRYSEREKTSASNREEEARAHFPFLSEQYDLVNAEE